MCLQHFPTTGLENSPTKDWIRPIISSSYIYIYLCVCVCVHVHVCTHICIKTSKSTHICVSITLCVKKFQVIFLPASCYMVIFSSFTAKKKVENYSPSPSLCFSSPLSYSYFLFQCLLSKIKYFYSFIKYSHRDLFHIYCHTSCSSA